MQFESCHWLNCHHCAMSHYSMHVKHCKHAHDFFGHSLLLILVSFVYLGGICNEKQLFHSYLLVQDDYSQLSAGTSLAVYPLISNACS